MFFNVSYLESKAEPPVPVRPTFFLLCLIHVGITEHVRVMWNTTRNFGVEH